MDRARDIAIYRHGMPGSPVDPALVSGWLSARSVCRGLPLPINDRGGFRVDTNLPNETRRWVFPELCEGLGAVGREVTLPRHFIKLCGTPEDLRAALPARWQLQPQSYFMIADDRDPSPTPLPEGYRLQCDRSGPRMAARVDAPDGTLAASGYAAEAMGVFIYDRIETAPEHRRKGLGRIIMNALKAQRKSTSAPELLVATEDGRRLYASLGWTILSPYSTAVIAG
ncbi:MULTISPECIES: GNAT family N-acetyltransferase [unclassified Sphingomonas]|uniref:GNAT family N-acetyltransferase n=1 Tax=unclassified Sphingomonas TaxID=196159 RepID=UPI001AC6FBB6|nr:MULTISPECIES: GNAT family N-acetyltransferase [unclassified Sphingomonas]MBN8847584.1 GNAT family N-acetyltransferase [Sphingomonas sp.]